MLIWGEFWLLSVISFNLKIINYQFYQERGRERREKAMILMIKDKVKNFEILKENIIDVYRREMKREREREKER